MMRDGNDTAWCMRALNKAARARGRTFAWYVVRHGRAYARSVSR